VKERPTVIRATFTCGVLVLLGTAAGPAAAGDRTIRDAAEIQKILRTVPFADRTMYPTLAERLPNLGLHVERVDVGALTPDDVSLSQGTYKRGDVEYVFYTNQPNEAVRKLCPITSRFALIRRGVKWVPDDRTSNFLTTGYRCAAP
jgi:hypothetical protein